ncbi:MAG: hypothetical protein U5Q03_10830 [Bacteroidota bacterium]|nr:hypothetical protein [Bacteroidota bacterium]
MINQNQGRWPLPEIISHYRGKRKTISFSEDDIDSILDLQYGTKRTYSALALLYSSLNFSFKYHQDHIYPKSFFNKRSLNAQGINDDDLRHQFMDRYNKLANLQLLQATTNIEKKNRHFEDWLNEVYPNESDRRTFLTQNHINIDASLKFEDFVKFYDNRRDTIRKKLMNILNVKAGEELAAES